MSQRIRYSIQTVTQTLYYQLPKFLFCGEFAGMSNDARILYALLRDRHGLSIRNRWHDENGDVFLYFRREEMQQMLSLSSRTVTRLTNELKALGLMEEARQGLGKPNKIYLYFAIEQPHELDESYSQDDAEICEGENLEQKAQVLPEMAGQVPPNLPDQKRNSDVSRSVNLAGLDAPNLPDQKRNSGASRSVNLACPEAQNLPVCEEAQPLDITGLEGSKNAPNKTEYNKTEMNETEENKKHGHPQAGGVGQELKQVNLMGDVPEESDNNLGQGSEKPKSPKATRKRGSKKNAKTLDSESQKIVDEWFCMFWQLYPRKVKKKTASETWNKMWAATEINADLFAVITQALEKANTWWLQNQTEDRYIPHPSTWINAGSWEDDLKLKNAQTQGATTSSSGTLPAGAEHDIYREIMEASRNTNATTMTEAELDAFYENLYKQQEGESNKCN